MKCGWCGNEMTRNTSETSAPSPVKEQFEKWAAKYDEDLSFGTGTDGEYTSYATRNLWEAWQAASAAARKD